MRKYALALEIAGTILLIALIAGVVLPAYNRSKDKAKEAEVKNNLHMIQLALERYGVDTEGVYPPYLIGGDMGMTDTTVSDGYKPVSDQLLLKGYLQNYPENPFVNRKNASAIVELQKSVNDPMRFGAQKKVMGTRFGDDCTLMGNVSCDFRYSTFKNENPDGTISEYPTGADFDGYPFFDVRESRKPKFYLPGEFFYKSMGQVVAVDIGTNPQNVPICPAEVTLYILVAYGSRSIGSDVFGPEPNLFVYDAAVKGNSEADSAPTESTTNESTEHERSVHISCPAWTRWLNKKNQDGTYPGSPYAVPANIGLEQISYGNPNGIRDAIILVLNPEGASRKIDE